jgi:GNAT superfamily N-acetyltransferase
VEAGLLTVYRDTCDGIREDQLRGFFVGWANPPRPATHLRLLQGSDHVVLALDTDADRVVGFITAIGDGILTAYIPYLEVLPDWQDRGIGTELTRRMLAQLKDLYAVDLLCDPALQPFYARFRMLPVAGMMLRRYELQAGRPAAPAVAPPASPLRPSLLARLIGRLRPKR